MITVVLADDHPVIREGLAAVLGAESDIEVVGEAGSGPEAVGTVRELDPDVLVLDLRMPGGDGASAIRELRRMSPERPRILVLTMYDTDGDVRRAMAAGADGLLLKDASRTVLADGVRRVARGESVLARHAFLSLAREDVDPGLTPRELDALREVARGGTSRAAAERLFISEATLKTHLTHAYEKLGAGDRVAAVRIATELGLLR